MCYTAPNTTFPCGGCPAGFYRCAGRCWHRYQLDQFVDHPAAAQYCANLGAHLSTPRTEQENLCPLIVAGDSLSTFWLSYQHSDGVYVSADGCGPLNYTKWAMGEPILDGDRTCVVHVRNFWYTDLCTDTRSVVCQIPHCYQPQCQ